MACDTVTGLLMNETLKILIEALISEAKAGHPTGLLLRAILKEHNIEGINHD